MSLYSRILAATRGPALAVNGDQFTYQPENDLPVVFQGIVQPQAADEGANSAFETLWARRSDFPALPVPGGTVTIDKVLYVLIEVKPDVTPTGSEGILLYLNREKVAASA